MAPPVLSSVRAAPRSAQAEAPVLEVARRLVPASMTADERMRAATRLLEALEDSAGLTNDERRALAAAVLELGYPWALHLRPEHLAGLGLRRWRLPAGPLLALVLGLLVGAGLSAGSRPSHRVEPGDAPPVSSRHGDRIASPAFIEGVASPAALRAPAVTERLTSEPVAPTMPPPRLKMVAPVRWVAFEPVVLAGRDVVPVNRGPPLTTPCALLGRCPPGVFQPRLEALLRPDLEGCVEADPLRLDCLRALATEHARLSRFESEHNRDARPVEQRFLELRRLEHERAAFSLYRRYLDIAPSDNEYAVVLVKRVRASGTWIEWSPRAADRELDELCAIERGTFSSCAARLDAEAEVMERRGARTRHPDDLRYAARLRRLALSSKECVGPRCLCEELREPQVAGLSVALRRLGPPPVPRREWLCSPRGKW